MQANKDKSLGVRVGGMAIGSARFFRLVGTHPLDRQLCRTQNVSRTTYTRRFINLGCILLNISGGVCVSRPALAFIYCANEMQPTHYTCVPNTFRAIMNKTYYDEARNSRI